MFENNALQSVSLLSIESRKFHAEEIAGHPADEGPDECHGRLSIFRIQKEVQVSSDWRRTGGRYPAAGFRDFPQHSFRNPSGAFARDVISDAIEQWGPFRLTPIQLVCRFG
jgi:hypothetical protein